ncbi:MAG: siderophore-interacting protein [Rhodococcus sp. (in: high G+C Gram-positive bacteria)]
MAGTVREVEIFPICLREMDVLTVEDVTPGMRRVILGGPAMRSHHRDGVELPDVRTTGFDDDIKLLPVDPATGSLPFAVPTNLDNGTVDWPAGSFPYSRTYTVRRFDASTGEMAVDFALHVGGLASDWAVYVQPGEKILVAGPKHSSGLPRGAQWMLLAGDETALPAIAHCLEKLPHHLPATVVIEVGEPSHRQELESVASVDITWLFRSENKGRSRLVETVQSAQWRSGQPYLWVAGEATTIKPLRRWAKQDRGIAKEFVEIAGYWRRRDAPATRARGAEARVEPADRVHEMSELLPPLAVRTAVTLGVFEAVDSGSSTVLQIAAVCRTDARATTKLLRHLVLMDLLGLDGDNYVLTDTGSVLAEQDSFLTRALHFDDIDTRMELAFLGLLESVRSGSAAVDHSFARKQSQPGFLDGFHEKCAFDAVYRAPALPDAVDLGGVTTVAIYGEAAGVYADALVRLQDDVQVVLVGLPAMNDRNFADVAETRRRRVQRIDASEFAPLAEPVDLAVVVGVVDVHPDADARVLLRTIASSSTRTVLITEVFDPVTADDHDTEDDLLQLCLHGTGRRTAEELLVLVVESGFDEPRLGSLGWGSTVVEFTDSAGRP